MEKVGRICHYQKKGVPLQSFTTSQSRDVVVMFLQ